MPPITTDPTLLILTAVLAYLLGSVPFGILITRAMGLGDLRQIGSGNIGATNVLRTGNKRAAFATLVLDAANQKDSAKLMALYPQVSDKLKAVEAETNDAEIQDIRKNLDELLTLAKDARNDAMPAKGDVLKSSFVKVYLKRG